MPYREITRLTREENCFCRLSAAFWPGCTRVGATVQPAGALAAALLNIPPEALADLATEGKALERYAMGQFFRSAALSRDYPAFRALQERLTHLLDGLATLPPWALLPGAADFARALLPELYRLGPSAVWALLDDRTPEYRAVTGFIKEVARLPGCLAEFSGWLRPRAEALETAARRTPLGYAAAMAALPPAEPHRAAVSLCWQLLPGLPGDAAVESDAGNVERRSTVWGETAGPVFAELLEFTDPAALLREDFYRGLAAGNAPRQCRSCGNWFLLTAGYNTCYCTGPAPGDPARTCRQVGAHRRAAEKPRTPAQLAYERFYNRLKTRKSRKKLTPAEAATALAAGRALLARAEQGELADDALAEQLALL